MSWLKSLPPSYTYVTHPQVGSQEIPGGVRVGIKDVAALSRVLFPKTAQEFASLEVSQPGESLQSEASLGTCST